VSLGRWHAAPVLLTLALALLANGLATAGELTELPRPIPAPALELEDLAGRVHRLEDYRGQVVLVNFWATWCPPCVAELPGMRRLAERMAERPFALLAVNAGEGKGRIYKFLGVIGRVEFPVLLDGSRRAYDRWEVQVLPTSYLVDPQGSVRYRVVGAAEWDGSEALEAIEGLLTEQQDALRPVGR
jgi:thiol-disulfide isomerase/thioredoxin